MRKLCPSYNLTGEMVAVLQGMQAQMHALDKHGPIREDAEARIKAFEEFMKTMERKA